MTKLSTARKERAEDVCDALIQPEAAMRHTALPLARLRRSSACIATSRSSFALPLPVFDSHLMHRSTDDVSTDLRAALVHHFAAADTVDHSEAVYGRKPANRDWLPVLRSGASVAHAPPSVHGPGIS